MNPATRDVYKRQELERLSPVNIIFQNEGVVGYDAEQHAVVFRTAMPQCEVLARLPAEIVIATAEPVSYTHLDVYKRQRQYRNYMGVHR